MRTKYSSLAFLSEVLVNVAVFSISCAILARVFSGAVGIAQKTSEENFAIAELYALTEIVRAQGEEGLPKGTKQTDGSLLLLYADHWKPGPAGKGGYTVCLMLTPETKPGGTLIVIVAVAYRQGEEICRLDTACYRQTKGGAAS